MSEIMKKTHKDSYFLKVQLRGNYSRESLVKSNEITLQTMVLNEKEVIVEVIEKEKFIVS
ncbi:hypothetical protein [Fredinandcohnia sp. 179-A 10B2 NHS]|uniref:hypothetical protein n=1 Tax=Fredinandcohnia sp. 179-A 10B2 NHS TaxID=3235176 RepID=UPI0039A29CFD